jgi:hypothetical protein
MTGVSKRCTARLNKKRSTQLNVATQLTGFAMRPWVPLRAAVAIAPGGSGWIPVPVRDARSTRVFRGASTNFEEFHASNRDS